MYTISKCEPARTFAKKDGSGDAQMQKVVLRDDAGKDYRTTVFSTDEAFVGDIVEATLKGYNEKFREYLFTVKSVTPGSRGIPNMPKEPTISVESENRAPNSRSQEESQRIVRQSTLKVVADLFSGKGDTGRLGAYLALADQMTEWVMMSSVTPRVSGEEIANLVRRFGSEDGAQSVAMGAYSVPFLPLLTKAQYDVLMDGSRG
jgi:hypothetical protein